MNIDAGIVAFLVMASLSGFVARECMERKRYLLGAVFILAPTFVASLNC